MHLIDVHSHWGTEGTHPAQSAEAREHQQKFWGRKASYDTEQEMADYFRSHGARAILDYGFTKNLTLAECVPYHDYAIAAQARHPDAILGFWVQMDPRTGEAGARELQRCIDASNGFVSFCVSAAGMGIAASDPIYDPFYDVVEKAGRPVLVLVGYTASGGGTLGGGGVELELCHPRYIDRLAIKRPHMQIISGRPAWPWQEEMIAVMLHKRNVWSELHGWSPKYYSDSLKREIRGRLKGRFMFGADYPMLRYERLVAEWRELGYSEEILADVFHGTAERLLRIAPSQGRGDPG
ncbi:MAG: amidohydrolase family protein [Pseudomonadota bacterium]